MAKKEAKVAERKATLDKNAASVTFKHQPFYNLANVRKDTLNLIVRSSSDPKKVEAIAESLEVLLKFLEIRAEHGAKVREADIAAAEAEVKARAKAAAEAREAEAVTNLKAATEEATKWEKVLKALKG